MQYPEGPLRSPRRPVGFARRPQRSRARPDRFARRPQRSDQSTSPGVTKPAPWGLFQPPCARVRLFRYLIQLSAQARVSGVAVSRSPTRVRAPADIRPGDGVNATHPQAIKTVGDSAADVHRRRRVQTRQRIEECFASRMPAIRPANHRRSALVRLLPLNDAASTVAPPRPESLGDVLISGMGEPGLQLRRRRCRLHVHLCRRHPLLRKATQEELINAREQESPVDQAREVTGMIKPQAGDLRMEGMAGRKEPGKRHRRAAAPEPP